MLQDWDAAAMQLQTVRPQKRRDEDEPEISDATDGLRDGDEKAHLDTAARGQSNFLLDSRCHACHFADSPLLESMSFLWCNCLSH